VADAELRAAVRARAAAPEDKEARARWLAAHLRAGGRDPRRDPRAGDVVESAGWRPMDYPPVREVLSVGAGVGPRFAIPLPGDVVAWREVDGMGHGSCTYAAWLEWARGGDVLRVARG
jgi:hypothetical protein